MIDIGNPYNRESLLHAIEKVNWIITKSIHDLNLDDYYSRYTKQWSTADTVQHLIKSMKPVNAAMRYPKLWLMVRYGTTERPSRRFDAVAGDYVKLLAKGSYEDKHAPVLYEVPYSEDEAEKFKKKDLRKWRRLSDDFLRIVVRWYDFQLDKYQLPHDVLDLITVRELVMFHVFHNKHHIESTLKRINEHTVVAQQQQQEVDSDEGPDVM